MSYSQRTLFFSLAKKSDQNALAHWKYACIAGVYVPWCATSWKCRKIQSGSFCSNGISKMRIIQPQIQLGDQMKRKFPIRNFGKFGGFLFNSRNFGAGANTSEIAGKFFMKSKIVDFPNHSIGTSAGKMLHTCCTQAVHMTSFKTRSSSLATTFKMAAEYKRWKVKTARDVLLQSPD